MCVRIGTRCSGFTSSVYELISSVAFGGFTFSFFALTIYPSGDIGRTCISMLPAILEIILNTLTIIIMCVRIGTRCSGFTSSIYELISSVAFCCFTFSFFALSIYPSGDIGRTCISMLSAILEIIWNTRAIIIMCVGIDTRCFGFTSSVYGLISSIAFCCFTFSFFALSIYPSGDFIFACIPWLATILGIIREAFAIQIICIFIFTCKAWFTLMRRMIDIIPTSAFRCQACCCNCCQVCFAFLKTSFNVCFKCFVINVVIGIICNLSHTFMNRIGLLFCTCYCTGCVCIFDDIPTVSGVFGIVRWILGVFPS